jgi:hypothetical protein
VVAAFLALAVSGLLAANQTEALADAIAIQIVTLWVLVPLSLASPATGVVLSLGAPWALIRHYWVLIKTFMTIPATLILLLHLTPIRRLALAAGDGVSDPGFAMIRNQMLAASIAALLVLIVLTLLSVLKPQGLTPFARTAGTGRASSLA